KHEYQDIIDGDHSRFRKPAGTICCPGSRQEGGCGLSDGCAAVVGRDRQWRICKGKRLRHRFPQIQLRSRDLRSHRSGDVQVGYVGSSPFAAATSRGLEVKAFYLSSISGIDEALVVRNGSGIASLSDLKGKKLAAAPVSTDHYQLLALIKSLGLTEKD